MTVLRGHGDELVMESSFAAVRELLLPAVEHGGDGVLEGAARLAAPVLERADPARLDPDRVPGVLHGLYWTVANIAERTPLLVAIDDAHWLDPASMRFLLYLGRRVTALPALVAVGFRRGEGAYPVGLLAALSNVSTTVLQPQPLSEHGSEVLVRRELGPRADEELCRSCHEATGGNPFYLRELAAALQAEAGRPTVEAAARVRSLGAGAVGQTVLLRLSRLGADCERLAEALAVLAPGSPLRHAASLAGLDREHAEIAADTLREADLVVADRALSFVHPIVRESIAAELPAARRAALHLEAARLLYEEGVAHDRVAAHLLSAEPYGEPWVIDALRVAAREALARGAPEAAVSYLRRALQEPPARDDRLELLVELGRAEALLPARHDFPALREALELAEDPVRHAEIALELAWGLTAMTRNDEVATLLLNLLERSRDLDPALVERIDALLLGGGAPSLAATDQVLARVEPYMSPAGRRKVKDPVMLAALAQTGALAGLTSAEAAELAHRALAHPRLRAEYPLAYVGAIAALGWADELEKAGDSADAAIALAQRRGSFPVFAGLSTWRGAAAFRAGDLQTAEAHLERAYEIACEIGSGVFVAMFYVPTLAERGRADQALTVLDSIPLTEAELQLWQGVIVLAARGCTRIALGQLEPGVADTLEADRRMAEHRLHLSVVADWVPATAAALAQLGRLGDARELAERELADAVAFAAPRRHGMILSASGLLDPGPAGLTSLGDAVALLEHSPARLEHARALVNLGSGLRARDERERAREPLARGLDLAERCGAGALAERALRELVAAGARPRRRALSGPESLTPAELRTARLAAEGLSNREIAEALFVATKTVEWQLSHVYAKLGIAGRDELAAALRGS
jgi:DNA-binding CsgD family transcriptional regulator